MGISPRILLASLRNVDGLQVTVLAVHFHPKEGVRPCKCNSWLIPPPPT